MFGAGILGSGCILYKLYDARKKQLLDLEKELAGEHENEALVKAQLRGFSFPCVVFLNVTAVDCYCS